MHRIKRVIVAHSAKKDRIIAGFFVLRSDGTGGYCIPGLTKALSRASSLSLSARETDGLTSP